MTFPDTNAPERTNVHFDEVRDEDHHTGISLLLQLKLGMVSMLPLDYMHLVYLGVMRRLINCWIRGPPGGHKSSSRGTLNSVSSQVSDNGPLEITHVIIVITAVEHRSSKRATFGQLSSQASQAELRCNPPQEQLLGSCPLRHLKLHYNAIHHKSNSWAAVLQGISSCTTMQSTTRATLGQLSSKASQAALQCNPPQEQLLGSCPPRHLKLNYNAIHHKSNSWAAVLQGISSCTTMQSTTRATLGQLSSKASQAALQCNPPQEQPLGSCPPRHLKLNYNAIHQKSNHWAAVLQGISS